MIQVTFSLSTIWLEKNSIQNASHPKWSTWFKCETNTYLLNIYAENMHMKGNIVQT